MPWLVPILWTCFWGYWAFSAVRLRPTARSEGERSYRSHALLVVLAFVLVMAPWMHVSVLGTRFLPPALSVFWTGVVLLVAGLGIAVWARYHLGEYWSGRIAVKDGHKLIRTGPYALARHPIYTGILLGMTGTAVALGEWRGVLAVVLIAAAYGYKIWREERLLLRELGQEYAGYRRDVKAIIPFVL